MNAYIYIENGVFLQAKAFGAPGECAGELVFNNERSKLRWAVYRLYHA